MLAFRKKKTSWLYVRMPKEANEKYKKLCHALEWTVSERVRYLIEKDLKNLEKQIQLRKKEEKK